MSNSVIWGCLFSVLLSGVAVAIVYYSNRFVNKRLAGLFEKTSPAAEVRSKGMIRQGYFEGPGVAQLLNGELCVYTFDGLVFQIPFDQVNVKKIRKNNIFGQYGWWGKTIIYLDTPGTSRMLIGVMPEDAVLWENFLKIKD